MDCIMGNISALKSQVAQLRSYAWLAIYVSIVGVISFLFHLLKLVLRDHCILSIWIR